MKTSLAMLLVAGTLMIPAAFSGCTDPIVPQQDTITMPPQVTLTGFGLRNDIAVTVLPPDRVGVGQLHVMIQVRNLTGDALKLAHQDSFVDERGASVQGPTSWMRFTVPPHGSEQFEVTSMTATARDFRTQINKEK